MTYSSKEVKPETPKFELRIEAQAYRQLRAYVDECPDEITGFGVCSVEGTVVKVHRVFILPQEVGPAHAEIEEEDLASLLHHCLENDIPIENIKFWWHSHVNMSAFWSATDTATISLFDNGWMVSLVTNKRKETKVRLDIYEPFRIAQELPFPSIFWGEDEALKTQIKEEIRDKVKRTTYATTTRCVSGGRGTNGYSHHDGGCGGDRKYNGASSRKDGGAFVVHDRRNQGRGYDLDGWGQGRGAQSTYPDVRGGGYWEDKSRGVSRAN